MGLLTLGTPLTWSETIPYIDYIKEHGIDQFINLYCKYKNREDAQLKWGDEIEYSIVKFDHANKKVRVSLHSDEILTQFDKQISENKKNHKENLSLWAPEFGGYMIEGTPGAPYGSSLECIDVVEKNMLARRNEARKFLSNDEALLSITFPSIGAPDFTSPPVKIKAGQTSESIFFSDDAVNCHNKRYITLMSNVLQRRGERLYSNVPIFKDKNTMSPFKEHFPDEESNKNSIPDHIYVDHMGFGVGMCCLQVTFQTVNVNEARWLYDQLTPITPIMLALSASTPIFRSYLADVDSRWDVIADLCDDRTPDEKGEAPLKDNHIIINKRRYDSTDCYIHPDSAEFNDIPLELDKKSYEKLIKNGIDEHLARHIAHIFIRDPIQVYRERLEQDVTTSMEHFETIQSSNWCNMRFKPPPIESPEIGWRVEFRATEIQLTDFENAAYCCFLVLLSRVLVSYNLSFLIPISQVTENMKRAQKRDAVHNQKFYFRNKLTKCSSSDENVQQVKNENCHGYEIDEMSINEIINGDGKEFVGLVPLIRQFLEGANIDVESLSKINRYLDLIQDRASGKIFTLAHWMRDFVRSHPEYQYDSHVGDTIVYDMIKKMNEITLGKKHDESLLGKAPPVVKPKEVENAVKKEQKPKLLCYEDALNGQKFANLEAEFH